MIKKYGIGLLVATLASSFVWGGSGKWTSEGKIIGAYIDLRESQKRVLIEHSVVRNQENDNCTNNGNYYELKSNSEYSDEAFSMILSLEAREKNVRFYLDGCGATGFPLIQIVDTVNVSK